VRLQAGALVFQARELRLGELREHLRPNAAPGKYSPQSSYRPTRIMTLGRFFACEGRRVRGTCRADQSKLTREAAVSLSSAPDVPNTSTLQSAVRCDCPYIQILYFEWRTTRAFSTCTNFFCGGVGSVDRSACASRNAVRRPE
jgi:hypothetical protein